LHEVTKALEICLDPPQIDGFGNIEVRRRRAPPPPPADSIGSVAVIAGARRGT
jgi:hypothetical protein